MGARAGAMEAGGFGAGKEGVWGAYWLWVRMGRKGGRRPFAVDWVSSCGELKKVDLGSGRSIVGAIVAMAAGGFGAGKRGIYGACWVGVGRGREKGGLLTAVG